MPNGLGRLLLCGSSCSAPSRSAASQAPGAGAAPTPAAACSNAHHHRCHSGSQQCVPVCDTGCSSRPGPASTPAPPPPSPARAVDSGESLPVPTPSTSGFIAGDSWASGPAAGGRLLAHARAHAHVTQPQRASAMEQDGARTPSPPPPPARPGPAVYGTRLLAAGEPLPPNCPERLLRQPAMSTAHVHAPATSGRLINAGPSAITGTTVAGAPPQRNGAASRPGAARPGEAPPDRCGRNDSCGGSSQEAGCGGVAVAVGAASNCANVSGDRDGAPCGLAVGGLAFAAREGTQLARQLAAEPPARSTPRHEMQVGVRVWG